MTSREKRPTPSLRARRAAAALHKAPFYNALVFWLNGDKQTERDASGTWSYFGKHMSPTDATAQDLEKVWADAVRIETLFPEVR